MSSKALLVGINYYGSSCQLSGCINDIRNVEKILVGIGKYKEIHKLHDNTSEADKRPTKATILKELDWLVADAKPGDRLWFHYSGHGSQVRDRSGDEADGKDECLCPVDYEDNGFILDDDLRKRLAMRVPAGCRLTVVLDCCHSGTGMDLRYTMKDTSRPRGTLAGVFDPKKWSFSREATEDAKYAPTNGTVICISGCRDNQTSADAVEAGQAQGAMTYALIMALQTRKYKVTYGQLLSDMRAILATKRYTQVPQMSFGDASVMDTAQVCL